MIKSLIHSMIVCPDMNFPYPRLTHGIGPYVFDEQGRKYLDASSGSSSVSNLGHGSEEMAEVIRQQVSKIAILPTHAFSSPVVEEYLDQLVAFAPEGYTKAWTVMSGTEAVENAVKLALQYHQLRGDDRRYKVISRWGTYHGNSIFTLDIGGMRIRRQCYSQWMNDFPHISAAYAYRKREELTEEEYVDELCAEFENCLLETGPDTVAAFIVEPVVAAALGAVPPPEGYFERMYDICQKYGILFVTDEILTGFGRTGRNFGMEHYHVTPDIVATGKGIGGGFFPMSAIMVTEKIISPFIERKAPFMGGHTFACNPVAAAVGIQALKMLKAGNVVENTRVMGELLLEKLKRLYRYDIVGDVRGIGLLCGVEFVSDRRTKSPFPAKYNLSKRIGQKVIDRGVILYPGKGSVDGTLGDHIMIVPPLIINEHHVDEIVDCLEESIQETMKEILPVENF